MFIPLDNLYEFISQNISNDSILIYQFYPHGSRKLENIQEIKTNSLGWNHWARAITLFMHDQEPLDFEYYANLSDDDVYMYFEKQKKDKIESFRAQEILDLVIETTKTYNIIPWKTSSTYDKWMLCHSEKNSENLEKYKKIGAVGVYWWSHAFIARDWYRFAQWDQRLSNQSCNFKFDFNLYCRAWQGSREYRLKVLDLLVQNDLQSTALVNFGKYENGIHWSHHTFKNREFEVSHDLDFFENRQSPTTSSATYSHEDYQRCAIDVVLETLFDDHRIHLTEKIIRPIACGKPFLLVSTPGSLEYIRSYGFETFGSLIDEGYDQVKDPVDRLEYITNVMKAIHRLPDNSKNLLYRGMHDIAQRNKKRFWSDAFAQEILDEFNNNYRIAFDECKKSQNGKTWLDWRKIASRHSAVYRNMATKDHKDRSRQDLFNLMKELKNIKS